MKKRHFAPVLALCLLMLSGCGGESGFPGFQAVTDSDMEVGLSGTEYRCHIRYVSRDTASVTFLSPESISGMTFTKSSGDYTCSLGSLLCRSKTIPDSSAAARVFEVYDSLSASPPEQAEKQPDGSYELHSCGLTVCTDSSGNPVGIRE